MARNEIIGMKELERSIKELGKLPQKCVTKAAKKGATIALKAARAKSPVDTGNLKKGVILKGEKRSVAGKKVYDVMMDPAMSDIYRKKTNSGLRRKGGKKKDANTMIEGDYYYPASMEYGFFARDGSYVPGDHYMRKSITDHARVIEETMVDVLSKEIDKELGKKG